MKLINVVPWFDFVNHGFIYVCIADDGSRWIRSTAGQWAQTKTSAPTDFYSVSADFDAFIESGIPVSENDIKIDNSAQIVLDPQKQELVLDEIVL